MHYLNKKRHQFAKSKRFRNNSKHFIINGLIDTFTIYCENSNLHGFHYIKESYKETETDQMIKSRHYVSVRMTVWIISIFVCAVLSLYLTLLVLHRYYTSPTITTIETNNYLISNVPFPGVTICNINSVYKPNIQPFVNILMKNGITSNRSNEFMSSLSALVEFENVETEFAEYFDLIEKEGYLAEDLMLEVSHPCDKMLKVCVWLGKTMPCKELFRITKSGFGYCCSFNYHALRYEYEIKTNASEYNKNDARPLRISGAGEDVSLRVVLDVEKINYMSARRYFHGTEVIIHDPEDYPEKSLLSAFSEPGKEVAIAVSPSVVTTIDDIKNIPVHQRLCQFEYEKQLHLTKKYSFQSCITECRAYTIIEVCDCLPYFYPLLKRENSNLLPPQCTLKDLKCLAENKSVFSSLYLGVNSELSNVRNKTAMHCNCLPSCTEKMYNVETFRAKIINGVRPSKGSKEFKDIDYLSSIVVYFKDFSCIKYRREMFMTWDTLLASFGGIFGLCLGGSILSLVEIFYHMTFKLYASIMNTRTNKLNVKNIAIDLNKGSHFIIRRQYPNIIFCHNATENPQNFK